MKDIWSSTNESVGHIKYTSANNCSDVDEDLNTLDVTAVSTALTVKKNQKSGQSTTLTWMMGPITLTLKIWTFARNSLQNYTIAVNIG